jgi:hypothetical protein
VVVPPTAEQIAQRGYAWLAARYRQTELSTDSDYWAAFALFLAPNAVPRQKIVQFLKGDAWLRSSRGTSAAAALLALAARRSKLQELTAEGAQFLVETRPNGLWAVAARPSPTSRCLKPSSPGDPARKRYRIEEGRRGESAGRHAEATSVGAPARRRTRPPAARGHLVARRRHPVSRPRPIACSQCWSARRRWPSRPIRNGTRRA